jgi:hypothetical protein
MVSREITTSAKSASIVASQRMNVNATKRERGAMGNNEKWSPVVGFEGLYKVSSLGRVKSLPRKTISKSRMGVRLVKERILKDGGDSNGYRIVVLGRGNAIRVHVLVIEAFVCPRPAKKVCNHKDGNKSNNCLSNLEWCSKSDDLKHAYKTGLRKARK